MKHSNPHFWDLLAVDAYRSILKATPSNAKVHFYLGLAYTRIDRNNKAIRSFLRAIKYDQSAATPLYHLGKAYLKEGKLKEAFRYLKRYQKLVDQKKKGRSAVVDSLLRETKTMNWNSDS